jgi:lipopolysaccharide transport system ATP-binding protein
MICTFGFFAVAAFLEPEILIIDEFGCWVMPFPEKPLARCRIFQKGGRTVLFVSHNMAAIKQLCTKQLF